MRGFHEGSGHAGSCTSTNVIKASLSRQCGLGDATIARKYFSRPARRISKSSLSSCFWISVLASKPPSPVIIRQVCFRRCLGGSGAGGIGGVICSCRLQKSV